MLDAQTIDSLVKAGGWAFAAIVLGAVIVGFVRGEFVGRKTHEREVARADQSTTQVARMIEADQLRQKQFTELSGLMTEVIGIMKSGLVEMISRSRAT